MNRQHVVGFAGVALFLLSILGIRFAGMSVWMYCFAFVGSTLVMKAGLKRQDVNNWDFAYAIALCASIAFCLVAQVVWPYLGFSDSIHQLLRPLLLMSAATFIHAILKSDVGQETQMWDVLLVGQLVYLTGLCSLQAELLPPTDSAIMLIAGVGTIIGSQFRYTIEYKHVEDWMQAYPIAVVTLLAIFSAVSTELTSMGMFAVTSGTFFFGLFLLSLLAWVGFFIFLKWNP